MKRRTGLCIACLGIVAAAVVGASAAQQHGRAEHDQADDRPGTWRRGRIGRRALSSPSASTFRTRRSQT